jgi:hypothetical protein
MSTIVISALAALTVASVPPSIGSEPVPANFEYQPSPSEYVAFQTPNQATSLGSEPTFFEMNADGAPVLSRGQHTVSPVALAASLGSEPFIVAFDESATSGTPRSEERRSDERIAQNCTCR